ncbi:MAG: hypothetical protein GXY55_00930 [Phycisphaerae bacterium]|nr:hypothetical protein [Phycisphaerae bacterium]
MSFARLATSFLLSLALFIDLAPAQIPYQTRQDIINYAKTGIGSPYVWGGSNWDPNDRGFGGADCSGFVGKCWSLTRWTPYRVTHHPYGTVHYIQTPGTHWTEVDRAEMLYGDAIVYRYDGGGHTYLYLSGDGWGEHEVYEARGSAYGIVHRWRTSLSSAEVTKGIRRNRLIENIDTTEHIVETDDGAPYYTDSGMTGSSQYDSYAPGCREGSCRYRWVTASRNETCTYTPNLPEQGWYRVYVTCNEDDDNVTDVGVRVNHALGTNRFTWNQGNDSLLNTWVAVGNQSFLFNAGMSGTVVWDDFDATPTDGEHIFRGDATKFSLDNRVEVNGVGGAPGKFATIREALAWLRTHASEEPDVINVTCDTLVESGCIEADVFDDLTILGDADGNGVPVTITVTAGTPSDWSQPCAIYLNIPIERRYELHDLIVIPKYVSPGRQTGAYGIVIDEQNPSNHAARISLRMNGVTVAGSLPGNVPTDPNINARAQATMFGGSDSTYGASVLQLSSDWAGDNVCRQHISASNLTITHGATRGLVTLGAYTDWEIDGGLVVSHNGLEGIKLYKPGDVSFSIHDSAGGHANRIFGNLGGGIAMIADSLVTRVTLSQCRIQSNTAQRGGGILSQKADVQISNSVITDNTSTDAGGGVYADGGTMSVSLCTIARNAAGQSAGGVHGQGANLAVANSILWDNAPGQVIGAGTVRYCDVQGGTSGDGNIDITPYFVDPDGPDDNPATTGDNDYHLWPCSPCVNAADPAFAPAAGEKDIDGQDRVQFGRADMGADEASEAAVIADCNGNGILDQCDIVSGVSQDKNGNGVPDECEYARADFNLDGDVDQDDFGHLQACLSGAGVPQDDPECRNADFNSDGDVDLGDLRGVFFDCISGANIPADPDCGG